MIGLPSAKSPAIELKLAVVFGGRLNTTDQKSNWDQDVNPRWRNRRNRILQICEQTTESSLASEY